jgi:hypothetical protein
VHIVGFTIEIWKLCFLVTTELYLVLGLRMSGAIPLVRTICLHGVFRDKLSFKWVLVFFIAVTASGVGVGQSSQSRAELREWVELHL